MNVEGDVELVDDMDMFSHIVYQTGGQVNNNDDEDGQTHDLEDSQRLRLMPIKDGLLYLGDDDDDADDMKPSKTQGLKIKPNLQKSSV